VLGVAHVSLSYGATTRDAVSEATKERSELASERRSSSAAQPPPDD
jgi:hypothetical protein